jgi:hypothetical protein
MLHMTPPDRLSDNRKLIELTVSSCLCLKAGAAARSNVRAPCCLQLR